MFDPAYPVLGLRGADYNPRAIAGDALEVLQRSIENVGFAKPVIVTRGGLIVAGHQRTRASRAMGRETVPAWVLPEITTADEIRFNQLHNGTDLDAIDHPVRVPPATTLRTFVDVPAVDVLGNLRSRGAIVRAEICRLIERYGLWGGAVATASGLVLSGQQYALACRLLRVPCRTFYVPDAVEIVAREYFGRAYGEFSYAHLPRATYVQTFAQMMRLRDGEVGKQNHSALYERLVLPSVRKGDRILDFGCGQGDYVKRLAREGHTIFGIEFFHRDGGSIDTGAVHRMIDRALAELRLRGRFDVVVCDSVLNSVDSVQAESDVLTSVAVLCKPGGRVFFSGRTRGHVEGLLTHTTSVGPTRRVEFMDRDGLTALFRKGHWFFQKFHSEAEALALAERHFGRGPHRYLEVHNASWQLATVNAGNSSVDAMREALAREFNLPWPDGRRVDRGAQALASWDTARTVNA